MMREGKVIQIIPNRDLDKYLGIPFYEQMKKTDKDLSFRKDKQEDVFPILMDSGNIKEGDILKVNCEKFKIESEFYIKEE